MGRILSHPSLVQIGKMSYSIYLWHWPAIVLARHWAELNGEWSRRGAVLVGVGIGVGLAGLAYEWIESPMRSAASLRWKRCGILLAGYCGCLVLCLGLMRRPAAADAGVPLFAPLMFHGMAYSLTPEAGKAAAKSIRYRDVLFPPTPGSPEAAWRTGGILRTHGGPKSRIVVFGSSHALMYARMIDDICQTNGWSVAYFAADGAAEAKRLSDACALLCMK